MHTRGEFFGKDYDVLKFIFNNYDKKKDELTLSSRRFYS